MTISSIFENAAIQLHNQLKQVPVTHVHASDLQAVEETAHLSDFLQILQRTGFLAAPIVRKTGNAHTLVGLVSLQNVIDYMFKHNAFDKNVDLNDERSLLNVKQVLDTCIKSILDEMPEKLPEILSPSDTVATVASIFTTGGKHRVLVIEPSVMVQVPDGHQVPVATSIRLITQYDLVHFLYHSQDQEVRKHMATLLTAPLPYISRVAKQARTTSRVIAMNDYQPILAAYNIMHLNHLHAVPVLDKDGHLVASISEQDLTGLNFDTLGMLGQPVSKKHDYISLRPTAEVDEAIDRMYIA